MHYLELFFGDHEVHFLSFVQHARVQLVQLQFFEGYRDVRDYCYHLGGLLDGSHVMSRRSRNSSVICDILCCFLLPNVDSSHQQYALPFSVWEVLALRLEFWLYRYVLCLARAVDILALRVLELDPLLLFLVA
jgi:hypothetical protein